MMSGQQAGTTGDEETGMRAETEQRTADAEARPLAGRRIAVTADRRADDQIAALERMGAEVLHAPTMRIVPVQDDERLLADTASLLEEQPAALLVTTGQGFRAWLEALPAPLAEQTETWIRSVPVLCRGPKARGAVRGAGFADPPAAPGETTESLIDLALEHGLAGTRIGFQRHGWLDPVQMRRLEDAGCSVHVVAPYRWEPGADQGAVERLIAAILGGEVDAVTFTAAPAVLALLETAARLGREDELVAALREGRTRPICVGHVTAQPLERLGITAPRPERERMAPMLRLLGEVLA